jgi:alpha-beta hydrolase superfamily lysophospholipase
MRAHSVAVALTVTALLGVALAACGGRPASGGSKLAEGEQDVSFVADGTTTYGTLDVPAHRDGQRLAAALLLAGSGPTDRNGDDAAAGLEPQTLKLIAAALARDGIMTLRFDKYFSGRTGAGSHSDDPAAITLTAFIRQADAAYAYLKAQPDADPARMLVVGHSEGGMYALLVAGSVSPRPAGLALIEPQDERLLSLTQLQTDEQLDAMVEQGDITSATAASNAAALRAAIAAFRAGRHPSTGGLLPSVLKQVEPTLFSPANATYVRGADAVDPPAVAGKLTRGTRVLVTDGTADANVPPSTIGPLVTALKAAGSTGPGLRLLPDIDHLLHPSGTPVNDAILASPLTSALQAWSRPYGLTGRGAGG